VIVGHGELLPQLQGKAEQLRLEGRVHWTGYQDEALPELYSAMDVVLFTAPGSDWGHRSISEAQGCGRPVVAISCQGVHDLIEDGVNGWIVDRDPAALSNAVDTLLGDSELAHRMGRAAAAAAVYRRMVPVGHRLARFLEATLSQDQGHVPDARPTISSAGSRPGRP
jgi:glycosyltransferase involved in cell wall biosynthesis